MNKFCKDIINSDNISKQSDSLIMIKNGINDKKNSQADKNDQIES